MPMNFWYEHLHFINESGFCNRIWMQLKKGGYQMNSLRNDMEHFSVSLPYQNMIKVGISTKPLYQSNVRQIESITKSSCNVVSQQIYISLEKLYARLQSNQSLQTKRYCSPETSCSYWVVCAITFYLSPETCLNLPLTGFRFTFL